VQAAPSTRFHAPFVGESLAHLADDKDDDFEGLASNRRHGMPTSGR
jgi:hypothetical protein